MDKARALASIITFILAVVVGMLDKFYTGTFWNRYSAVFIILIIASLVIWPRDYSEKEEEFKSEPRYEVEPEET